MGTIISVYSRSAYKEFILPAADNTDYSVCLRSRDFHIERPVNIELEVLSGIWYIKDSDAYTVGGDEAEDGRYMLTSDKVIPVTDKAGDDFRIIAKKTLSAFTAFTKYSLSGRERVTIGRTPDNDICYDNLGLVSKRQASIERSENSWNIYNYGKNGIYVDSKLVKDEAPLDYGESINIAGLRIVFLRDHIAVDESRDNVFVHPEMEKYHGLTEGLAAEARPAPGNREAYPYKEKEFSTNTKVQEEIYIEQPVIGVGGWKKTYQEYLIREEKKVHELTDSVRDMLLRKYPSSAECMDVNNGSPLWDRSISDDGVMTVRLGTGDTENPCKVTFDEGKLYLTDRGLHEKAENIREKYRTLRNVPVTVDIGKYNVVRITAEDHRESSLTALMTAVQLAQHISPFDLRTAFIFDEQREDETNWEKARLLPHVWSEDLSSRYFARDRETAGETVYRLARVLLSREDLSDSEISALPRYVVFISDRKYAAGSLLEKYMMQKRYLGFTVVYISESDDFTGYPEELRIRKEKGGELSFISSEGVKTAAQDDFDQGMFEDYARRLASSGSRSRRGIAVIPDFVSLLGTYGVRSAEDLHIDVRWAKNRTYEHIRGVLGKGAGNMTRYLDLHERYNGPHVLIAGTTGSGKSELLQSFILSLATEYSPEDINFILIDFKGGGMANALADLPHTSGCITNLSGGEAERAMLAVKCEILSRQRLLNDYGINHIDDYVRLYKNGEVKKPLPHLVITVDEFAELRKEKPGFMSELISVAQTGRSLGIHLVLATQRPRGNVDDDIRTNMHSVICLRVQDKNDSLDVIDRPDAAYITSAGRGYLEVGAGEVFEPFQAAFSGTSRFQESTRDSAVMLTDDGRTDVVSSFAGDSEGQSVSQLDMIKEEIKKANSVNYSTAEKLWLDALDEEIHLSDISHAGSSEKTSACIGMIDDPEERKQYPLKFTFPDTGNVAVVGMPSSGKTTCVRTIMESLIRDNDPDKILIYGLDLDTGNLADYAGYDQVKRIVTQHDTLEIESFLDELQDLEAERKNESGDMRDILIFIDSYEDFRNTAGYRCENRLTELLREAPGTRMYFIITGGGFGLGQISGSAERNIKTVLSLSQRNKYEYMDALRTSEIKLMPENLKGRGLTVSEGRVLEFQIAVPR